MNNIEKIINHSLRDGEYLHPIARGILEHLIPNIIEISAINKSTNTFRVSSDDELSRDYVVLRILNHITAHIACEKFCVALIDSRKELIQMIEESMKSIISSSLMQLTKEERSNITSQITENLLTAFNVTNPYPKRSILLQRFIESQISEGTR